MSIYERYELLDIVNDGPVKTFRAREIQTGQIVAVHLLLPLSDPQGILQKVRLLTDPARQELREFGDHEGTSYVVTNEWKRMVNFPDWLNAVAGPPTPPPAPQAPTTDRFAKAGNWRIPVSEFGRKMDQVAGTPAPPEPKTPPIPSEPHPPVPEPPAPVVGEFTRMFEAAKQNQPQAGPARTEQIGEFTRMFEAQNPSAASNAGSSANETPGEFTRMFDAPAAAPRATPQPPLPSAPAAKVDEPGEFTRMFQTPSAPMGSGIMPAPPPPSKEEAGSFTRTFEVPVVKQPSQPVAPPPPPPQAAQEPGEFTRMFQTPAQTPPPPASPVSNDRPFITPDRTPGQPESPVKSEAGEFTRMFQTPAQTPPPPPPAQAKQEPSEFTRMFQTPAQTPPPSASPVSNDRPFITPDRTPRIRRSYGCSTP